MDKISIITICFNCESVIENTLKSVISQTFCDKEYVVVDGGSTDKTLNIIRKYEEHIDVLISEPDNGIYDAINKGIKNAKGEWIICMNAGDVFYNENVLLNISKMSISKEKLFLYSDYYLRSQYDELRHIKANRKEGNVLHQSSIYRKKLHDIYGYYIVTKPYIVSDLLFFLSIPEKYFMKVPYCISINTMGGVSETGTWCMEGALSLQVVFRLRNIHQVYMQYLFKRIVSLVPDRIKYYLRKAKRFNL